MQLLHIRKYQNVSDSLDYGARHCLMYAQTWGYRPVGRHSFPLESVEVCKFKAHRVLLPWNDNCEFVSFFFSSSSSFFVKGGEAAGNQRLSKSKKWYCHTSRMAVWCLFKRGGKKKNSPGDWIISSCQYVLAFPPPSITATCFIFSSAVLSDSYPRAMCCSVRPQIP